MFTRLKSFSTFLNPSYLQISRSISLFNKPLFFQSTPTLYAEPLKKKKRIDPAIVKAREEKRKRKLEKEIRKLEKADKQFKPIDEIQIPIEILNTRKERTRKTVLLSEEEKENRILLIKNWAKYRKNQHLKIVQNIDRVISSQQKALDELRKESEELYQEAIQIDSTLIPFYTKGPTYWPPIKDYPSPDGDYHDISKKWE